MDWRQQAYQRRQQQRWLRPDAARWVRPDAAKFLKPGARQEDVYPALALKYNPDQPRVPAGNGRDSGRWGDGGSSSGRPRVHIYRSNPESEEVGDAGSGSSPIGLLDFGDVTDELGALNLFDITPRERLSGGLQLAGDPPERLPEIVVTPGDGGVGAEPGIGHNGGPPLEDPPENPRVRPRRSKERTATQRTISSWIGRALHAVISFVGRAIARRALTLLKVFGKVINSISWLRLYRAQIETYRDPPKTLEELQRAVKSRRPGTEVHHRAEKEAMRLSRYSWAEINAAENLVRIPTLKHYEITGWYQTPNDEFGGMTPREYLADKALVERLKIGNEALIRFGVMKP